MAKLRAGQSYWIRKTGDGDLEEKRLARRGHTLKDPGLIPSLWKIEASHDQEGEVEAAQIPPEGLFITKREKGFTRHEVKKRPVGVKFWYDAEGVLHEHIVTHTGKKIKPEGDDIVTREITDVESVEDGELSSLWLRDREPKYVARSVSGSLWEIKTQESLEEVRHVHEVLLDYLHHTSVRISYGRVNRTSREYMMDSAWIIPNPHLSLEEDRLNITIPSPDNRGEDDIRMMKGIIRLFNCETPEDIDLTLSSMSPDELRGSHDVLRIMQEISEENERKDESDAVRYFLGKIRQRIPIRHRRGG